jgi:hypothetical protein
MPRLLNALAATTPELIAAQGASNVPPRGRTTLVNSEDKERPA